MSNTEDFNTCLPAILALPNEDIKVPTMPVEVFVQEAEDLKHWAEDDAAELGKVGLDPAKITNLAVRAGACREGQSMWNKEYRSGNEWNDRSPGAYELRDELIHTFRFAYRNDERLLSSVNEIAEGSGSADLVQDLNDLAVLGKKNPEPLTGMGFDIAKLEQASILADELGELLAVVNGTKLEGNENKDIRDRAYTYLKQLVDEVREYGKFVFWKDEKRLQGYASNYWRKKRSQSSKEESEELSAN